MTITSSLSRKKLKTSENGETAHAHGLAAPTVKMAVLPKAIYRVSAIPIKNLALFIARKQKSTTKQKPFILK